MKSFLLLLIGFWMWNGVPVRAEDPSSFIAQADAAYMKREDLSQAKIALEGYEKAIALDPQRLDAYWKASRTAHWIGDHADLRADRLIYFQRGTTFATQAIALHADCVEAHFWLGANQGSYGETKGVLKSLFLVKPIRHEMAEVIRINDTYEGGGAYRVLGVVDYQVPGIAGGSRKRAKAELEKALVMDPSNPFTHYYLAEYYKMGGDKEKARAEVEVLRTLKVSPDNDPELRMLQKRSEKFL